MIDGDVIIEGKVRFEIGVKEVVIGVEEVKVFVNEELLVIVVGGDVNIVLLVCLLMVELFVILVILEIVVEVEFG